MNSLNSRQLHDALKIFLISSHFSFHIFTTPLIFCLHAVVSMRKKLNYYSIKLNLFLYILYLSIVVLDLFFNAILYKLFLRLTDFKVPEVIQGLC